MGEVEEAGHASHDAEPLKGLYVATAQGWHEKPFGPVYPELQEQFSEELLCSGPDPPNGLWRGDATAHSTIRLCLQADSNVSVVLPFEPIRPIAKATFPDGHTAAMVIASPA